MKQKQKPLSFSLCEANHNYIAEQVAERKIANHRYNRSMYMDDLITHLRTRNKPVAATANIATVDKKPVKRFKKPTALEIEVYMAERGINDSNEAQSIYDFYESKGWVVGKAKMKCWKAAVRNWLKNYKAKSSTDILATSSASDWHLEEDKGF